MLGDIKKPILLLSVSLLILSVCVQPAFAYTDTEFGFSVDPPEDWTATEPVSLYAVVFTSGSGEAMLNVMCEESDASFSEYIEAAKSGFAILKDYNVVSEQNREINGQTCYENIFTFTTTEIQIKTLQVFFENNDIKYILSFGTTSDLYDTYATEFESILQTFQTTNENSPSPNTQSPDATIAPNNLFSQENYIYIIAGVILVAAIVLIAFSKRRS